MRRILALLAMAITTLCAWCYFAPVTPPPITPSADFIIVSVANHQMQLLRQGRVIQTYHVALGRGGPLPKSRAGDNRVPHGRYFITQHKAPSAFHLALRIGYPTPAQSREAAERGLNAGGDVMIHGLRRGLGWLGPLHRQIDWTRGCIAVTDEEIEQIWRAVPDGTPIEITG